jgi:transposase
LPADTHGSEEVRLLREEIAQLRAQIAWLKKRLFGPGQSETLDHAQLVLQIGALEKLATGADVPTETITYERTKEKVPRVLPAEAFADLPVKETIILEPSEVQAEPAAHEKIGEERTFEVDVVPPQLFRREIIRPKYVRGAAHAEPPVIAAAPARAVNGGYASAGLLAWIALSKYVDHLPLYRLEKVSARWGEALSRQTMADWIALNAQWLGSVCPARSWPGENLRHLPSKLGQREHRRAHLSFLRVRTAGREGRAGASGRCAKA